MDDRADATPQLNLDAVRALRAQIVALVPEQPELGVQFADAMFMTMDWMELAQAELTTLRAREEDAEAERDNYKAAFDAMRPFVAQIEQTIASAAEQIQQAEAVASEIAAERDRLASALAGVREQNEQQQEKIRELKRQLTFQRDDNHARNVNLDALHYVWCSGGCASGVHRYDGEGPDGITQEIVDAAVQNTERLKAWWANRQRRVQWEAERALRAAALPPGGGDTPNA